MCSHKAPREKSRDLSLAEEQLSLVLVPLYGVRRELAPDVGGC